MSPIVVCKHCQTGHRAGDTPPRRPLEEAQHSTGRSTAMAEAAGKEEATAGALKEKAEESEGTPRSLRLGSRREGSRYVQVDWGHHPTPLLTFFT